MVKTSRFENHIQTITIFPKILISLASIYGFFYMLEFVFSQWDFWLQFPTTLLFGLFLVGFNIVIWSIGYL